jgi:N-acyl amino acid synthase of PEP-CTERM/exosortase system
MPAVCGGATKKGLVHAREADAEARPMFDDKFRVCFADTTFGIALHQRIRYQVFCLDKGFEDPGAFSTTQETDAWDDQSAHFVVQNKQTGEWVAATRIVLPKRGRPLPVDTLGALDRDRLPASHLRIGEISRFCIIPNRTQSSDLVKVVPGENSLDAWGIGTIGRSQQFEVTLGMIRTIIIFALKRDLVHCVMLITDAFARLLRKLGVKLHQVGPVTEHRGMRTAYLVNMRESALSMSKKSSAVRDLLRRSKHAYVRISSIVSEGGVDTVSEYAPDHSLFNETIFRETVLLPADKDSDLRAPDKTTENRPGN